MGAGETGNCRSAREVCGSVGVGGKNPKSVWWNDEIKAAVKRKEVLGSKMNKDVNGNRKLFWKEVSNAKGGKLESWSRIKDRNGRLAQGRIWNEYVEDLYNIDTQE